MKLLRTSILTLIFFLTPKVMASKCITTDGLRITWTAFKTLKKTGVHGSFNSFELILPKDSLALEAQLNGLILLIDPTKLSTDNPVRDQNIVKYFFNDVGKINLKVLKVSKSWINASLKLNGIRKNIPFRLKKTADTIEASAHIDILDFGLNKALVRLNRECFSLHEGKTWSHVETKIKANLVKCKK